METADVRPVKLRWRKARGSFSNGNCVEVAAGPEGGAWVRNSRFPDGPVLEYTASEWAAFVGGAKAGEFDDLIGA
jgi:hypothetical protein